MRIALYHNLPSGGAKRAVYELIRRLVTDHEVDVFTLSSADHVFADVRSLVARHRVYPFQPGTLFHSPFGRLNQLVRLVDLWRLRRLARQIAQDIEEGGYDVVFVHPGQFEKAPSVLRFCATPMVYYCQEPLRELYEQTPPRPYDDVASPRRVLLNRLDPLLKIYVTAVKRTDAYNIRQADRVLVNSHFMQEVVGHIYSIAPQVNYLGVDVSWFQPLEVAKRPFLFSVGSLTPMKGFDFLITAVGQLPPEQRLPLVIASNFQNPPERAYLQRLAQEQGVELHLEGNVTEEKLRQLYNEATLVLYAPVREPFGLVPLESMACGTAVVAVREGGMQESIVPEQTGLLTERDPRQFAQAVARLLANPQLVQEYGRNGRQHVLQNWTWERATAILVTHLRQVARNE